MKKSISALLIFVLLLLSTTVIYAKEPEISVYIDKNQISFEEPPIIIEDTTMVPFRPIFEKFGIQVSWNDDTKTVTGTKDNWKISLSIDSTQAIVNGEIKELPLPAQLINGNTFIPLRFVGEATGRDVLWDNDTKTIKILTSSQSAKMSFIYSKGVKYEGDLKGEIKEGKGKYFVQNNLWYEGDFKANKMDGFGKEYDLTNPKSYYEGQFVNNLSQGNGKIVYDDGSYFQGEFKQGVREGQGKLYDKNNILRFEGSLVNNSIEGLGKKYNSDGILSYEGNFKAGLPHGMGKAYSKGQLLYQGEFVKGNWQGNGKLFSSSQPNLVWYEGEFLDNKPHGIGKMFNKNGRLTYEGDFKYYQMSGKGKVYFENGNIYEGEIYILPEGFGKLMDASGRILNQGYFMNGKYVAPSPDEKDEHYMIMQLKKGFIQQVIDGTSSNKYKLDPTEAIMFLDLPTKDALSQFQQLSVNAKKELINSYVQEYWGNVIGVKHCYGKVRFEGSIIAETDISYQVSNEAIQLELYPEGK